MQSVLNIIAILGFALSLFNLFFDFWKRRKNIRVEIQNIFSLNRKAATKTIDIINLRIYNDSSDSISVSRITIGNKDSKSSFGSYRKTLLEVTAKNGDTVKSYETWHSLTLPIRIDGKGFTAGLFAADVFKGPAFTEDDPVDITILSNKGCIKHQIKSISFSDLELLSDCQAPD